MKDLIAKLQLDANCALGAIWMHIDAQAARIAELEAQIAAASALAVERQTWSHITPRDFVEVATAIMDQHGLMDDLSYEKTEKLCEDMEASFKKLPHPVQADTDKLREALKNLADASEIFMAGGVVGLRPAIDKARILLVTRD